MTTDKLLADEAIEFASSDEMMKTTISSEEKEKKDEESPALTHA